MGEVSWSSFKDDPRYIPEDCFETFPFFGSNSNCFQRRRAEQQIDQAQLLASLAAVHKVGDKEHAAAAVRDPLFSFLDLGERSLWAHALTRSDAWVLCGTDRVSLRLGVRLGFRDRLCALETLLNDASFRPKEALRANYTAKWLARALNEMVILEGSRRP